MSQPMTCRVVYEDGTPCNGVLYRMRARLCRNCSDWSQKRGGADPDGRRPRRRRGELEAELRAAVRATTDECVILSGYKERPTFHIAGRLASDAQCMNAARAVWIMTHGDPGPSRHVLHQCNGGSGENGCINIRHLYLGNHTDNMQDVAESGQNRRNHEHVRGEEHGAAILTEEDVREIRRSYVRGHRFRPGNLTELAARYGVSTWTLKDIVQRRSWAHLE